MWSSITSSSKKSRETTVMLRKRQPVLLGSIVVPASGFILIDKECPHGPDYQCRCALTRNVELNSGTHYFVTVDCSCQGLTELPRELPPFTTSLNISNNNITHLDFLDTNSNYKNLMYLYADNNRIESITVLEGSHFIDKFTALSLRNNNIRVIPKYLLSNVFDRNNYQKVVHLGKNKLPCDCSTAQVLKVWLLANKLHISDYDELLCENLNNMRVVDLEQAKVCVYSRDWTDYIYYIIAVEICLFFLLITKVTYDYWIFKTTGYLPWPASKMPRLPCDWVFEL
ncbi:protein halfway-like [Homalodisca vitripennis]|uniref:protein halfway-like n=1 Tax=Homalodisca vitripennis TaxID=197043 RepID=UPI001EEA5BB9|nr:protein halfway-like [Homalodisca vitripennis]